MVKEIQFSLYSPRFGHSDPYTIKFDENELFFKSTGKEAKCLQDSEGKFIWSGHDDTIGNPILNILEDNQIYPPSPFLEAIISAWNAWRIKELSDEQLESELTQLFKWVDVSSRNKPNSDFWIHLF